MFCLLPLLCPRHVPSCLLPLLCRRHVMFCLLPLLCRKHVMFCLLFLLVLLACYVLFTLPLGVTGM